MNSEMTPREHDDMRDLVLAGAQRIRPARHYRRVASIGLAVIVVAAITGGVAAIINGRGAVDDGPVVAPTQVAPTESSTPRPMISPSPTPTMPPEWCEPVDFPEASLPQAATPAPGQRLVLQQDPCLTGKSLLGSYEGLENQGVDADLIQGFQRVAGITRYLAIESWTAPLSDRSGMCILFRNDNGNGWQRFACDAPGAPATLTRTVNGTVLRFVIEDGAVVVYATSP